MTVTAVPIANLGAADALSGSEMIPLLQDGVARRSNPDAFVTLASGVIVPAAVAAAVAAILPVSNANLAEMAQATVKGRAAGTGTGTPTDLTQTELTALVIPGSNLVGRLNVPVLVAATRSLTATDAGKGIVQTAAAAVTLTVEPDATENLGDGFVTTLAVTDAGGSLLIVPGAGVTITSFNDGTSGDFLIDGVGIATLWRLGANSWGVHGTNVEEIP